MIFRERIEESCYCCPSCFKILYRFVSNPSIFVCMNIDCEYFNKRLSEFIIVRYYLRQNRII